MSSKSKFGFREDYRGFHRVCAVKNGIAVGVSCVNILNCKKETRKHLGVNSNQIIGYHFCTLARISDYVIQL